MSDRVHISVSVEDREILRFLANVDRRPLTDELGVILDEALTLRCFNAKRRRKITQGQLAKHGLI